MATGASRSIGRLSTAAFALLAFACVTLAASTSAETGEGAAIAGDPVVGGTLTWSDAGATMYRWQSCDPAEACTDAADDTDWVDRPAHTSVYTVAASDLGQYLRVLSKGPNPQNQWQASERVGPVTESSKTEGPDPGSEGSPPTAGQALAPKPKHGASLLAEPVGKGSVRVKLPGQKGYVDLEQLIEIPVNSVFDASKGRVRVTAATGPFGNQTPDESMDYYRGKFKLKQAPETDAIAVAQILGKLRCGDRGKGPKSAARASGAEAIVSGRRKKKRRRLWGSGSGRYGTAGRGGTGSVRGTTYLVKDTCKATFFKVTEGIGIDVHPKGSKKVIPLGPGDSYRVKR